MSAKLSYAIPAEKLEWQQEIKKSRFLVDIAHTPSVADAKHFIQSIKKQYPGANHHCSAFVAGSPLDSQCLGSSDDGEPSGTAGRPMLAVLQGSGIGEVAVVVTRFFGGIKLGSGGLVKAYSSSTSEALKQLATTTHIITEQVALCCEYDWLGWTEKQLKSVDAVVNNINYAEKVELDVKIPIDKVAHLIQMIDNNGKGLVTIHVIEQVDGVER